MLDFNCLFRCPYGYFPIKYICRTLDEIKNLTLDDEYDSNCSIKKFFEGECIINLNEPIEKQKFIEKASNQDIEMHVDINPFAKSIDKNISLEINPTEVKEVEHEYCERCGTICDDLTYCPHCGKKLK